MFYTILNKEYDDLSTVYWMPKLHRNLPYRDRCIAGGLLLVQQKNLSITMTKKYCLQSKREYSYTVTKSIYVVASISYVDNKNSF